MQNTNSPLNGSVNAPALLATDWNEEWKELQRLRNKPDDPHHWDIKSKNYHSFAGSHPYVERFIKLTALRSTDTVFDMGCGNGALAIPLAQRGHAVLGCDFSQGMLDALEKEAKVRHLNVQTKLMSWADDWQACGVAPRSYDVAIASRSIVTADLKDSLVKLSSVARRRCAITLPTSISPRIDGALLRDLGIESPWSSSHIYAFMIVNSLGYLPEVAYIISERDDTFDSKEEAYQTFLRMVNDALGEDVDPAQYAQATASLQRWLDSNLVENGDAGKEDSHRAPQKRYKTKAPRKIIWAHIAWDVA